MNKQSLFSNFTNALLCTSAVWAHTVSSSSTTNLLSLKSLYLQTAWIRTILHTTFKRSNCVELEFNFTSFTKRLEASFMAPAGTVSTTVRPSLGNTCACVETKKWNFARPDIWQLMWKILKKKRYLKFWKYRLRGRKWPASPTCRRAPMKNSSAYTGPLYTSLWSSHWQIYTAQHV